MRITEQQAKRWDMLSKTGDGSRYAGATAERLADARNTSARVQDLELEPEVEDLIDAYQHWQAIEDDAATMRKEIALRLMEYRFISISKLAEELGISRPTLYAWQKEADEASATKPAASDFGRPRPAGDFGPDRSKRPQPPTDDLPSFGTGVRRDRKRRDES